MQRSLREPVSFFVLAVTISMWSTADEAPGNGSAMTGFETLKFRGETACSHCHCHGESGSDRGPARRFGRFDDDGV